MSYTLRLMREADYPLLNDFLYEAIFVPEGTQAPPRSILSSPELQVYVNGFGSETHDIALLAEVDGQPAGAAWVRIMNDYGHVDDQTPSFAISLYKAYRGMGIGTALMRELLRILRERGYAQASLAVQKANYAAKLYQRLGFEIVGENEQEYIMVCRL